MTYAFTFDASSCSGCKACQAACKDKNNLPVGVLWRRVYEVSGGEWEKQGSAWTNTVFAYNLSIACNHCEHPKCAGVCPVDAYVIRPDGIVYIDETKCVGCGYCAWACPYGAPQYNHELGHMTKCNFCFDNIDSGNPPACVAACPLRVLNYVEIPKSGDFGVQDGYIPLWTKPASEHPFPMSPISRTEPHLAVKPHKAMVFNDDAQRLPSLEIAKSGDFAVQIGNVEEIRPRKESAWDEIPLVIFTLLAQLSVGAFWFALLFLPKPLTLLPLSIIGLSLGLGMSFSFAHLGTKKNAWRVLTHLRKSWLSREILSASLFGAGWLAVTVENLFFPRPTPYLSLLTALLGLFFIHSMVNVYRIPAKPAWNTWRTNAAFFISALLLGMLAMLPILLVDGNQTQSKFIGVAIVALIVGQWSITGKRQTLWQNILNFTAIFSTAIILFGGIGTWQSSISVFAIVFVGELLTRMRFYAMEQKT